MHEHPGTFETYSQQLAPAVVEAAVQQLTAGPRPPSWLLNTACIRGCVQLIMWVVTMQPKDAGREDQGRQGLSYAQGLLSDLPSAQQLGAVQLQEQGWEVSSDAGPHSGPAAAAAGAVCITGISPVCLEAAAAGGDAALATDQASTSASREVWVYVDSACSGLCMRVLLVCRTTGHVVLDCPRELPEQGLNKLRLEVPHAACQAVGSLRLVLLGAGQHKSSGGNASGGGDSGGSSSPAASKPPVLVHAGCEVLVLPSAAAQELGLVWKEMVATVEEELWAGAGEGAEAEAVGPAAAMEAWKQHMKPLLSDLALLLHAAPTSPIPSASSAANGPPAAGWSSVLGGDGEGLQHLHAQLAAYCQEHGLLAVKGMISASGLQGPVAQQEQQEQEQEEGVELSAVTDQQGQVSKQPGLLPAGGRACSDGSPVPPSLGLSAPTQATTTTRAANQQGLSSSGQPGSHLPTPQTQALDKPTHASGAAGEGPSNREECAGASSPAQPSASEFACSSTGASQWVCAGPWTTPGLLAACLHGFKEPGAEEAYAR